MNRGTEQQIPRPFDLYFKHIIVKEVFVLFVLFFRRPSRHHSDGVHEHWK